MKANEPGTYEKLANGTFDGYEVRGISNLSPPLKAIYCCQANSFEEGITYVYKGDAVQYQVSSGNTLSDTEVRNRIQNEFASLGLPIPTHLLTAPVHWDC